MFDFSKNFVSRSFKVIRGQKSQKHGLFPKKLSYWVIFEQNCPTGRSSYRTDSSVWDLPKFVQKICRDYFSFLAQVFKFWSFLVKNRKFWAGEYRWFCFFHILVRSQQSKTSKLKFYAKRRIKHVLLVKWISQNGSYRNYELGNNWLLYHIFCLFRVLELFDFWKIMIDRLWFLPRRASANQRSYAQPPGLKSRVNLNVTVTPSFVRWTVFKNIYYQILCYVRFSTRLAEKSRKVDLRYWRFLPTWCTKRRVAKFMVALPCKKMTSQKLTRVKKINLMTTSPHFSMC